MKKFITQIAASALLLAGLSTYAAQPVPNPSQLLLKSGIISTSNDFEKKVLQTISSAELFQGRYYRIVQFNSIPTSAEKMAIESSGIRILNYIPNRAFILSIPESYNLIRLAEWNVRTILALEPEMKLARILAEHNYPAYAQSANNQIDLVVQFFSDNSIDLITNKLLQEGIIIEAKYSAYQQLHVRVDQSKVDHLASLPFIKWIALLLLHPHRMIPEAGVCIVRTKSILIIQVAVITMEQA
ncbi:MAG: hypothetical protein IPQ03_06055 [Bacteroidetes bacterium]|nr:hypothetical protein [Bacteroidota bacterium]